MVDGRGSYKVYDEMAEAIGDSKWNYCHVQKFFKKMENYHGLGRPNPNHGKDGWLQIGRSIPQEPNWNILQVANEQLGITIQEDFGGSKYNVAGIGPGDIQAYNGTRSNSYKDLLYPLLGKIDVEVRFNSLVSKIILDDISCSRKKVAIGVEYYDQAHAFNMDSIDGRFGGPFAPTPPGPCGNVPLDETKKRRVYARKEVILSAGTFQSPQILMLSGIGPKEHLESLGVPVKVNRKDVGSNLTNHVEASVIYEFDPSKFMWGWQGCVLQNPFCQPQQFGSNLLGHVMDWFSDLNPEINPFEPDIHFQIFNVGIPYVGGAAGLCPQTPDYKMWDGVSSFQLFGSQFNPQAPRVFLTFLIENLILPKITNGTVRLQSANPQDAPLIDPKLYEDEDGIRNIARSIINIVRPIMSADSTKKWLLNPNGGDLYPGPNFSTEDQLVDYIKKYSAYGHHQSGTCGIKKKDQSKECGVVDSKLRVLGVKDLRVIDVSVYPSPYLHAYNIGRGAYLVGEMGADFILQDL